MPKEPSDTARGTSGLPSPGEEAAERDTWDDWMESALDSFASEVSEEAPAPAAPAARAEPAVSAAAEGTGRAAQAPRQPPPDPMAPDVAPGDGSADAPTFANEEDVAAPYRRDATATSAGDDGAPPRRQVASEVAAPAAPAPVAPAPLNRAAPERRLDRPIAPATPAVVPTRTLARAPTLFPPVPPAPAVLAPPVAAPVRPAFANREPVAADRALPLDREDFVSPLDPPEGDADPEAEHWWPEASPALAGAAAARTSLEIEAPRTPWWSRLATGLKRPAARRSPKRPGPARQLPRFDFSATHLAVAGLVLLGLAELVVIGFHLFAGGPSGPSGLLNITSRPAGAQVLIDGEPQGVTPAAIRVPEGLHTLELRSSGPAQVMALQVDKDAEIARFFDLPIGTAGAALRVATGAAGARVLVDGRLRGRSPVTVTDLNPGPHTVRVENGPHWLARVVTLEPGARDAVTLTLPDRAGTPSEGHGWLTLAAPMELRVSKKGALVGTTRAGPLQLTAGRHELEFVNEPLGVRITRTVDVVDGRTTAVDLALAPGMVSIAATPAGQVTIDGEPVGAAPIATHPLPAGQHDIVVRHGQLGERRLMITVPPGATLTVTVDFRR